MCENKHIIKRDGKFMVACSECQKERFYKYSSIALNIVSNKVLCKACVHKGERWYRHGAETPKKEKERLQKLRTGVKHRSESKIKASESQKNRYLSKEERDKTSKSVRIAMHKPDIRKRHIQGLFHSPWFKVKTDKGQLELLEKWNRLEFKFETNYQVHNDTDLFYVDGYDKDKNVVIEYDTKYHLKLSQQEKDRVRQNKIIDILNPKKFWRYDSVNRKFRNVLERNG